MGTRASAEGEGNRGGDRAKSERDHAEGSGRAHPHLARPRRSGAASLRTFATRCLSTPMRSMAKVMGIITQFLTLGSSILFFCFRFEGTAGFVSDQHGGSSRRFGSGSRRERDRFRRRSQERPARPERHRRRHLQHGCHTCLSLAFLSPRQRSVWPMKSPRGASDAHPPFEIPPSKDLGERRLGVGVFRRSYSDEGGWIGGG